MSQQQNDQEPGTDSEAISHLPTNVSIRGRKKVPKAAFEGTLAIADASIPCAVLEDGTRVLTQRGVFVSLGRNKNPTRGQASLEGRPAILTAKNLEPFIPDQLRRIWAPIPFRLPKGSGGYKGITAFGYRAEILPLLCSVFIDAEASGKLKKNQRHIAEKARILVRGFGVVGIVALVDEATGYQKHRSRDALQLILKAYVLNEYLPWTKQFPDEFYEQLFRLRNWQYSPFKVSRPQLVGKLTNEIVYERLPEGVLQELQRKNPIIRNGRRAKKHHQFLTEDIGNPHLERHLAVVTALMRASKNWISFMRLLERAVPKPNSQLRLPIPEDNIDWEGELA